MVGLFVPDLPATDPDDVHYQQDVFRLCDIDVIHLANPVLGVFTCCRWLFVFNGCEAQEMWVCADLFSLLTFTRLDSLTSAETID